jgi:hypothetical protein
MSDNFKDSPQVRDALDRIRKSGWDNAKANDIVFYVGANISDSMHNVRDDIEQQIEDVRGRIGQHEDVDRAIEGIKQEIHLHNRDLRREIKGLKVLLWCIAGGVLASIVTYIVIHLWLVPHVVIR